MIVRAACWTLVGLTAICAGGVTASAWSLGFGHWLGYAALAVATLATMFRALVR